MRVTRVLIAKETRTASDNAATTSPVSELVTRKLTTVLEAV